MPFTANTDLLDGQPLFLGDEAFVNSIKETRTYYNAETATVLPFGFGVTLGTVADGDHTFLPAEMPDSGSDTFIGIVRYSNTWEKRSGTPGTDPMVSLNSDGQFGVPVDEAFGVVRKGVVGVLVANTVTPASSVYLVHTANSASKPGMFRSDADTSNAMDVSAYCKFLESGTAGDIVRLAVDLP